MAPTEGAPERGSQKQGVLKKGTLSAVAPWKPSEGRISTHGAIVGVALLWSWYPLRSSEKLLLLAPAKRLNFLWV